MGSLNDALRDILIRSKFISWSEKEKKVIMIKTQQSSQPHASQ